jgi:hypothetical protein
MTRPGEHALAGDYLNAFDETPLQILDFGCFGLAQHRFSILDFRTH